MIIETGELKDEALIRKASEISIKAGADFIKTSTGKVAVNATPESARIRMEVIRDMGVEKTVGFKPAGGVRTAEDAQKYLAIADELFGACLLYTSGASGDAGIDCHSACASRQRDAGCRSD